MDLPAWVSNAIAGLALLLSVVATIATIRFNARQKSLIESQEQLNQRLLQREEEQSRANRRADLGANLVKVGKSNWRLKIFNRGEATARNVTLAFPEGSDLCMQSEIESKFPLEILEPQQGVDIMTVVHAGTKGKHAITIRWDDDDSTDNAKTAYVTL